MNKDLIRQGITSYSIQFTDKVEILYSFKIGNNLKCGYFNINEDINFNNQELIKDMIVENIVNNIIKDFIKDNYEMLTMLNYVKEDKIVKELL
ncbi:MAG: hypothetical protein ACLTUN_07375 [Paraclostridium sordellii]